MSEVGAARRSTQHSGAATAAAAAAVGGGGGGGGGGWLTADGEELGGVPDRSAQGWMLCSALREAWLTGS